MDEGLALILSSSLAVTVVTALKEILMWYFKRKDEKEDKKDEVSKNIEKLSETDNKQNIDLQEISRQITELQSAIDTNDKITRKSLMILFGDRIHHLSLSYIERGEIKFEEKLALTHMWECYHYDLGGNGTYDDLMKQVNSLKIIV